VNLLIHYLINRIHIRRGGRSSSLLPGIKIAPFTGAFLFLKMIRIAKPDDAEALLAIYSPFILNSGITQETEIPSPGEFRQRIVTTLETKPWLVCEIENEIAGYAYAGKHRDRKGYQWCIEPSVYLNEKYVGRGVASALYKALFEIVKKQGYVNVFAVITLPNERSVTFHESFGFTYITKYKNVGYKLGRWHDVGWWQYQLNEYSNEMKDPVSFPLLDADFVNTVLQQCSTLVK
jgi:phosphinothricin acetyltransferase